MPFARPLLVEICVDGAAGDGVSESVEAAHAGGAHLVELCRDLSQDGLTPSPAHMRAARAAFRDRRGLMVMIRPRAGDFCYTEPELRQMETEVAQAADAGADGVVLGATRDADRGLDLAALQRLTAAAHRRGLSVTCHRAFDALPDREQALAQLVSLGISRVLTSGVALGQRAGGRRDLQRLAQTLESARGRIQVVLAGGIDPANVAALVVAALTGAGGGHPQQRLAVHAHSGITRGGKVDRRLVADLVAAAASVAT